MAFNVIDRIKKSRSIWVNGEFMPWDECRVHVLAHVLHYGSALFEGIRVYRTKTGPQAFRLTEHVRRLYDSCRIYRMTLPIPQEEFRRACLETVRVNGLEECYIRPLVFRGYGALGVNPLNAPIDLVIAVWEWGSYLGPEAHEKGVDVRVSSWTRIAPNTLPALAKASANYANSQLIKLEALADGYVEGIALDASGFVSEGSGENLFVVRDGVLSTPPLGTSVLPGITRDSVIRLARDLGLTCVESRIPREALYIADEVFFTGTAAEVTPIRSIDRMPVGDGKPGRVTRRLSDEFQAIVRGAREDRHGWLTPVASA